MEDNIYIVDEETKQRAKEWLEEHPEVANWEWDFKF